MEPNMKLILFLVIPLTFLLSCQNSENNMNIQKESFGTLSDGTEVFTFTISNDDGSKVVLTNYGAALVNLFVPDKIGNLENVVLGFDNIQQYEIIRGFYGATVGRFGNRIASGKFTLDDKEYILNTNDGPNHLHGGDIGFDRVLWNYEILNGNSPAIKFSYLSKDGEEGYPGNFNVSVTYSFSSDHKLKIDHSMYTDKPTVKNVTNHSYFNLSGNLKSSILDHSLKINADKFLPVDSTLIPTGELRDVDNTPMDFTAHKLIGRDINADYQQLKFGLGYDHCWVFNDSSSNLKFVSELYEPVSGRVMKIHTTEPALQFYSGNFMDGSHSGSEGKPYNYRHAVCLETQHYPDSPNQPNFPSTRLEPGEIYNSTTVYEFLVRE